MVSFLIAGFQALNELLAAGVAITAFSLLLYAFSFNLRDRVARSFALILLCVVIVFVGEAMGSVADSAALLEFWLRLQWVGIIFLPAAYLHLSDAVLATTGRPSRGRRRLAIRLAYLFSFAFLLALPTWLLVGPLVQNGQPAPHLERTWLSWVFTFYYISIVCFAWVNFWRASQRTMASSSRRRMRYLLAGALAPALGSFPYLLFGSSLAAQHTLLFWVTVTISNLLVSVLLVVMAYAVAFFGVSWPDRVVKRRLFKWLMRGPFTAMSVLAVTTLVRRAGQVFGASYSALVPVVMVGTLLVVEHFITLAAPLWERWLFFGGDRSDMDLVQALDERLLTVSDLRQFLETVLAAVCDRLQTSKAFIASLEYKGEKPVLDLLIIVGDPPLPADLELAPLLQQSAAYYQDRQQAFDDGLFSWGDFWLLPLYDRQHEHAVQPFIGLLGVMHLPGQVMDEEQSEALLILSKRAEIALNDRRMQEQAFSSLQALTPEIDLIQRLRAAARYDGTEVLTTPDEVVEDGVFLQWVKDALTHYWGGPKLTQSPLMDLNIVQQAVQEHEDNPTNALRAILRQAIDQIRPEGERKFTAEWILYNILEMKFMEGRKVREIALRLSMSEADLYRKQRVAIEAVASAIMEMEERARHEAAAPANGANQSTIRPEAKS